MGAWIGAHKKLSAAVAAVVIAAVLRLLGVSMSDIKWIVGPLLVFIGGQALSDVGKEAVKEEAKLAQQADSIVKEVQGGTKKGK